MVKIKVRSRIDVSRDIIWNVISDLDNDAYFWRGITSTRVLSKNGNKLIREVILGDDNPCIQDIVAWPVEKIRIRWIRGGIKGTKDITLLPLGEATLIEVQMNYEFPGVGNLDSKLLAKLFQNESELGVELIKKTSEQYGCGYLVTGKLWMN